MKSPTISRKDSYKYIISKEINKGTKITSNPLEKLTDHCIKHKITREIMKDVIYRHNYIALGLHFVLSFFLLCCSSRFHLVLVFLSPSFAWLFIEKSQEVQTNSPRGVVAGLIICQSSHSVGLIIQQQQQQQ